MAMLDESRENRVDLALRGLPEVADAPSCQLVELVARPLAEREELMWGDLVPAGSGIVEILSVFIALLELAKRGTLSVRQPAPFTPLQIRRESSREAA